MTIDRQLNNTENLEANIPDNTIYHKHHIIPKHAGGTNDPSNIIKLTIEEHAQAHKELYEKYGKWEDKCAWLALSKSITFAEATRMAQSEANKGPKTGRRLEATIENARKGTLARIGKKDSEETKRKRAISMRIARMKSDGKCPGRYTKIVCDGVEYSGIHVTAEKLGISRYILTSRLKSEDWENWYYVK